MDEEELEKPGLRQPPATNASSDPGGVIDADDTPISTDPREERPAHSIAM